MDFSVGRHHGGLDGPAGHYEPMPADLDLREAFARDPQRFESLAVQAPEVFADLSKEPLGPDDPQVAGHAWARSRPGSPRDAMFAGEPINTTEGRAVLHTALRAPARQGRSATTCTACSTAC